MLCLYCVGCLEFITYILYPILNNRQCNRHTNTKEENTKQGRDKWKEEILLVGITSESSIRHKKRVENPFSYVVLYRKNNDFSPLRQILLNLLFWFYHKLLFYFFVRVNITNIMEKGQRLWINRFNSSKHHKKRKCLKYRIKGSVLSFLQIENICIMLFFDYVHWITFQFVYYGIDQSLALRVRTQRGNTPLSSYSFMSTIPFIQLLQRWTQPGIWTIKENTYWTDHRNTSYSTYQPKRNPSSSIGHFLHFPPHFIKWSC